MTVDVEKTQGHGAAFTFVEPVHINQLPTASTAHDYAKSHFIQSTGTEAPAPLPEMRAISNEEFLALVDEEVPELSQLLGRRANQLDVIYLYCELLKLMEKGKEQDKISRREERLAQLDHIQEVIKNLQDTASFLKSSGITGGIMSFGSGLLPMVGFTKFGGSMLDAFKSAFESFDKLKPEDAFNKLGKWLQSMSQMNREMGEVRKTNAEASRFKDQQHGDLRRSDGEEETRGIEELKQDFRATIQTLLEILRQNQDVVSTLYSR